MAVLGIDPGTAITGYGVVDETPDGNLFALDYGVIETPSNLQMPVRLMLLHNKLTELIHLHHPRSGAVEKLFFQRNVRTALSVGQARGVVLMTLAEQSVDIAEYTPLEVKQAVAGYGGADKKQVQTMVQVLLGLQELPQPDDAADALAIAICHLHSSRYQQMVNQDGI
jgi:crossover junction endodeoxyribonuclease RuvC